MRILEISKSNYLIRLIIYSILVVMGLVLFSSARGFLFIVSIPIFVLGIYYIISDLILIKDRKKIIPIESRSRKLLWILSSAVILSCCIIVISNDRATVMYWSILFICVSIKGAVRQLREDTLVSDDTMVERLNFLTGAKIRWSEVSQVIREPGRITIQSIQKDYIVIDVKRSTEREIALVEKVLEQGLAHGKLYTPQNG